MKKPARMTAGEINRELDKLERESSVLTSALIDLGLGNVRYNDLLKMVESSQLPDHPTARRFIDVTQRESALRQEIMLRYGDRISRLPTERRGWYGPRER